MTAYGWSLFYHRVFKAALDELEALVAKLAVDDPRGYKGAPQDEAARIGLSRRHAARAREPGRR